METTIADEKAQAMRELVLKANLERWEKAMGEVESEIVLHESTETY